MKKNILVLLVFIPLSLNAQWEIINDGFDGSIKTIDFVNDNVGWLAGINGTLLKTSDGGEDWNTIDIADSLHFNQIDFNNESIGWAIINSNIYKTNNGGITWTIQLSDIGFGALYVIDENNVYSVGGKIYKTSNGGTDWIDVSPNLPDRNYNSLWFQDSQMGVVVGNYNDGIRDRGVILRTTNGGISWNENIVNEFNNIFDLQFLDNSNGYFRANNDSVNFIYKTEDMLLNWTLKTQHPFSINSFQFLTNNIAYAIMGDTMTTNNLMKSTNGGVDWQNVQFFHNIISLNLSKIYFNTLSIGFIYGGFSTGSILYKSTDGGYDWTIKKFNSSLNDASFFDKDRGIIVGGIHIHHEVPFSHIFSTTDAGKTWKVIFNMFDVLRASVIVNESTALSLASRSGPAGSISQCEIFKTTNQGNNWTLVYDTRSDSTVRFHGYDITFMNEEIGWAVGRYRLEGGSGGAAILSTIDGGENWVLAWTDSTFWTLNSIWYSSTTGWAVGEGGTIIQCTPQTGWVQQTSVTDLPLNKVFFSDENHGWVAGGYQNEWDNSFQSILLKTTNGGINWIAVPNIPYLFRDIAFIDNTLGWAIGYDSSGVGGILETTDGGITWSIDTGNLPAKLNALHIKDNYGWVVGDNGLILRTTDAGAVWVEEENDDILPTEFVLEQNYPNPFNPSTKISWQSPVSSHQTIKIFDVLGREVETVVDEYREAGTHSKLYIVNSTLPSGVYFYQLKAGDFTSTKKMLLLK